jgi:alkanesulfonate monooxygenase SsuD/methylene tetrahydromethanopterin reductase-like flavin-dependent oxidoreductase (luciferase family)
MKQRIGVLAFWKDYDRKTYLKAAILADRLGYDSFWLPEVWGYEAFGLLTEMAVHTKRIKLGTGIVNVFSRSPALIAMSAATLDDISGGRFILGLGTSGKKVIEGLHGRDFQKPLTQTRDVIRVVRAMLEGRPLNEAGTEIREYRPFTLNMEPKRRHIPIYVAALKPKAIESIGELADGWMPIFWPYDRLDEGRKHIEAGARRVGRDPSEIVTAPYTTVIPLPGRMASQKAREIIAFYIGGMGEYYKELLSGFGYADECQRIEDLYKDKATRSQAEDAVTDGMIEALTVSGNPIHCARELRRRKEFGLDQPLITLPPNAPWPALKAFLYAMAPWFNK